MKKAIISDAEIEETVETVKTEVYDPKKQYTWAITEEFILTGGEFGLVLNSIRAILNTEEAAKILLAHEAAQAIEKIMAEAVSTGVVKEKV